MTASEALKPRSGGQILVDQLVAQDVKRVYCIPGESYLAALDALYDAPPTPPMACISPSMIRRR